LVGHVRAGAVPEPMRGRFFEQISPRVLRIVAFTQARRSARKDVLDDGVQRRARKRRARLGAFRRSKEQCHRRRVVVAQCDRTRRGRVDTFPGCPGEGILSIRISPNENRHLTS